MYSVNLKKDHLILLILSIILVIFISGCVPKEATKVEKVQEPSVPEDYQKPCQIPSKSRTYIFKKYD